MARIFSTLITSALVFATVVSTQTNADENRPVFNKGVCDPVKGATPGLYGLCVAYCEAQVGPEYVDPDNLEALKPSHKNILRNYERRMKEGDPQMPCVNYATECPVFDTLELAKINSPIGDVYEDDYEYSSINNGAMIMRESVRSLIYGQELPWWRDGRTVPLVSALTAKRDNNGVIAYTGQYYDSTLESPIFRFQELTLEEYNGCRLAIKNNKLDTDSGGFCGDGFRTAGPEQCDDGNNIDGDGCSAICALE